MLILAMFKSPKTQWENILTKPFDKQRKLVNKVCKVTKDDTLILRGAFFDNLPFPLVHEIFKVVRKVVEIGDIDPSFEELIFDRFLGVSEVAHLYPEDKDAEDNIIFGEGYHVYTACYHDLDTIVEFINSREDIHSICDLGSGSGRALFYLALESNKELEYAGLELVEERVDFTNNIVRKFNLQNMFFKTSDFLETPEDFHGFGAYYLYDPVGTDEVDLLASYFSKMIADGAKFYILFVSGWDDLMLNALDKMEGLEKLSSNISRKQPDRFVNFYRVKQSSSS